VTAISVRTVGAESEGRSFQNVKKKKPENFLTTNDFQESTAHSERRIVAGEKCHWFSHKYFPRAVGRHTKVSKISNVQTFDR